MTQSTHRSTSDDLSPLRPPRGYVDAVAVGVGAYSVVYRARHELLGRVVALKVLNIHDHSDGELQRFTHECRAMAALSDHPQLLTVHDAGLTDEGLPFIAMEYLPGGSAQELMSRGPLDPAQVARLGLAVADALAIAHDVGIVHRDVKPANVLLGDDGAAKLGDFGVSSFSGATLRTTTLEPSAVTIAYAAPEVLEGGPATIASDLYSLGATVYALASGVPPYLDGNESGLVQLVGRISAGPPSPLPAVVPDELVGVIETAMAHEPSSRFADASTMAASLRAMVEPGWAAPLVAPSAPTRRSRRRPLIAALVAVAVASLVVWTIARPRPTASKHSGAARTSTTVGGPPAKSPTVKAVTDLGVPRAFDRTDFCRVRGEYVASTNEILDRGYNTFVTPGPSVDLQHRVIAMQQDVLSDAVDQFLVYARRLSTGSYTKGPIGSLQVDVMLVLLHHPNVLTREFGLRILEHALNLPPPPGQLFQPQLAKWWDTWWGFATTEPDVLLADAAFTRLESFATSLCGDRGVEVTTGAAVDPQVRANMASSAGVTAGPT